MAPSVFTPVLIALAWTLALIQFLRQGNRPLSAAFSPQEYWRTVIALTVYLLALAWVASATMSPGTLMVALYHARYWPLLIALLLALIFWQGSVFHMRWAFFTGAIVLLALDMYTAVAFTFKDVYEGMDAALKAYPVVEAMLEGYTLFCCVLVYLVLVRRVGRAGQPSINIVRLLVKEDPEFARLTSPEKIWGMIGKWSCGLLALGMIVVGFWVDLERESFGGFFIALYRERLWCLLCMVLLVVIFWLGSFETKRLAGITGVVIFAGMEIYSVQASEPSFHWILMAYAAFCLALLVRALVDRTHPHGPHPMQTGG